MAAILSNGPAAAGTPAAPAVPAAPAAPERPEDSQVSNGVRGLPQGQMEDDDDREVLYEE